MRYLSLSGGLALVFSLVLLSGCGGRGKTDLAPAPRGRVDVPEWFLNTPTDPHHLYATATMTSRDLQVAIQKAQTAARTELAQQMEARLGNLTRQFQEEVGLRDDSELLQQFTSATKIVTDQTLVGSRADQREILSESGIYRAYVLMSLPIGQANQLLMQKIRENESLYTRFRATQAFEELNRELEALRE